MDLLHQSKSYTNLLCLNRDSFYGLSFFSLWRSRTVGEHPSLPSSAAAAPVAWTPRLPQPPVAPAAAPACRPAPRPPTHRDPTTAAPTPQRIYSTTAIKVKLHPQLGPEGSQGSCQTSPVLTASFWQVLESILILGHSKSKNVSCLERNARN